MARQPGCLCGDCKKCRNREANRRFRESNPERWAEIQERFKEAHPDSEAEASARYRASDRGIERADKRAEPTAQRYAAYDWEAQAERERVRKSARWKVKQALISGTLVRQTCWCGEVAQAHHEDYDKPLEVVWLCTQHHADRHSELRAMGQAWYAPPRPRRGG